MTKLKDLPEGTLLISSKGRQGLYSNDNAPIFVMELGNTKANVLWQGTSRYDAFMHPLVNKSDLEKNVDYVLPEDIGIYLPTLLDRSRQLEKGTVATPWSLAPEDKVGSFMPSGPDLFCSKPRSRGTDGTPKGTADKYYVKMNDSGYLNVDKSGTFYGYWEGGIKLSDNSVAFEASKKDSPWIRTLFTPSEYNSIAEEINQNGSWDEQLPLFDPDNPMFEKVEGTTESSKEKDDSESGPLDEPTFKVHVGNHNLYLNVLNPGVDSHWHDAITLDDGRVIFASNDSPYQNVQVVFTLGEYKDIYNKVTSMDTNGEELFYLPEYDSSNTDSFELVHGESLPEDKGSEEAPNKEPNKEPKFMVQVGPGGNFLNEELVGDTPSRLRGTIGTFRGDPVYLLNGHALFLDDDSNDDMFKTHFTLEEYNDLREQVNLLEGHEDLSWSLPEYDPDNDSFTLVEGSHLPESKDVPKLPKWVKDILDNLAEDADDPTAFTKEINTLVQFMGDKNWGFYLYQKVRRMQSALKNHHYSKNEAVAAAKSIIKEAKKHY